MDSLNEALLQNRYRQEANGPMSMARIETKLHHHHCDQRPERHIRIKYGDQRDDEGYRTLHSCRPMHALQLLQLAAGGTQRSWLRVVRNTAGRGWYTTQLAVDGTMQLAAGGTL